MAGPRALIFAIVCAAGLALPALATTERVTYMKSWNVPHADNPHGEPVSETVKRRRRRLQDSFSCGPTSTSSSSSTTSPPTMAPATRAPETAKPTPSPTPKAPTPAPVNPPTPAPVERPTPAPVEPPTPAPMGRPTPAPMESPTTAPVDPPTPAPVDPPTPAPVKPPTPAPVEPPTPAPVKPPTPAPVDPPTAPPVAPTEPPVAGTSDCEGGNPCENGGSCSTDPAGGYRCSCARGYAGMHCQTSTAGLPEWKIELEYNGDFDDTRRLVFQEAADRWARVIPFVPGGGSPDREPGVLTIECNLEPIDGPGGVLGSAGPTGVWEVYRGISYTGSMNFDSSDIIQMENDGTLLGVITHEMGHVIGVGTLWDSPGVGCSICRSNGNAEWQCPAAAEVYAQLADAGGANAPIIETSGGSGTACGHFNEDMFDDELMTGFVTNAAMPLSKLTCASLEDIGYVVRPAETDEYVIPSKRPPNAVAGPPEKKVNLRDEPSWGSVTVKSPDGTEHEEELPGLRVRF